MSENLPIIDAEIIEIDDTRIALKSAQCNDLNVFSMWQKYANLWANSIRLKVATSENVQNVELITAGGVSISYRVNGEVISDRTRREYVRNADRFFVWLRDTHAGSLLALIKGGAVAEYAAEIASKSPATQAAYLGAPRRFFDWASNTIDKFAEGLGAIWQLPNPFNGIKPPAEYEGFKHDALSAQDAAKLIHSCKPTTGRTTAEGKSDKRCGVRNADRDSLVCNLALRLGLRCVEIARLTVGDIDLKGNRVYVLGKVGTDKVPVPIQNAEALRAMLKDATKGRDSSAPLIQSISRRNGRGNGEGITADAVQRIIRRRLKDAELWKRGRVTPHSLRHTAETLALIAMKKRDGFADIRKSAQLLRHSAKTAERYAHDLERQQNECAELISTELDAALIAAEAKPKRSNRRKKKTKTNKRSGARK